jgi:hypothetical protein
MKAFSPIGDSVTVAASTTSASGVLPAGSTSSIVAKTLRVYNGTASVAFFRTGAAAGTAVATDTFVAPGGTEVFNVPSNVTSFDVILATGTGNVYAQLGGGA